MSGKAERTTQFIIETVAPIFNKHGYIGTSMSQLTQATGLTKGAIYGNFENKLALALAAFEYNSQLLLSELDRVSNDDPKAVNQLFGLLHFYRHYDAFTMPMGGCPLVNVGVDAQNNNSELAKAAKQTVKEIETRIAGILDRGVKGNEFHILLPPLQFAKQFFTILQGGVVMATLTRDRKYLINTVSYLEHLTKKELRMTS
ncbi:TetR/AcrR family transcriptional regulator [Aureicoccus marinus]|jgi:AcrR family transcriptional regulator|uniref:TetR family transcriptional regulator n=1 Tax=Aureicoccus marinus TaxID=754435 RepID=A0A2S7T5F5_9FLAO|nr:TetR/AcrR family transcriptional regulator [Aureicoccus marinus]PQJ14884.1 TetR family transcriptional regulator [Aureicoccus marinus]